MKKYLLLILTLILAPLLFLVTGISRANATASYCPSGPTGYETGTSASTYTTGQAVNFCLADNTRDQLFANPEWKVLDSNGATVYSLPAGPAVSTGFSTYEASWNQTDSQNQQVPAGQYTLVFPSIPGEAKATFTVEGNTSSSSSSSNSSQSSSVSSSSSSSSSSETSSLSSSSVAGPIPPANLNQTVWYPVSLTQNMMSSYYLTGGATTTFTGTMANYSGQTQTVLVDVEIYNAASKERVARETWDNVTLQPFGMKNFSLTSPSGLPAGNYFVAVGVYAAGGGQMLGWYSGYQNFTVAQ